MTKGEATQIKIHFKGQDDDFIVFVDDNETYKKWLSDKSVPMAHFVSTFKVFVTHKQGTQGQLDDASKSTLAAEFGTDDADEVIKQILEKGNVQETQLPGRQGHKNEQKFSSIIPDQPKTR
ncbi:shwachman-Bodian-diamond syndrome protein [Xylariaceae sp. FL1651]|nr:shwachman-Bodian-diamond syndrome protein [Xylariaceae sp. FL1651]